MQQVSSANLGKDDWLLDSGSSKHVCGNLELLKEVKKITPFKVYIADGTALLAAAVGETSVETSGCSFVIKDVYFFKDFRTIYFLSQNLLNLLMSISRKTIALYQLEMENFFLNKKNGMQSTWFVQW